MPIASVAKSGRPILMTTSAISGNCPQPLLDALADVDRIGQRDARQLARLDQDRALVEPRHELGADEEQRADRDGQDHERRRAVVRMRWFIAPRQEPGRTRRLEPSHPAAFVSLRRRFARDALAES